MIQLKNVSKFYHSKGMITSGISKVNLTLDRGEFVVITGESGSGKTTLLNVISGLDSYEEGEMYIDGQETSHYMAADFEKYRKKYIGNIFQSYNLINSYTVYQNVELILRINGYRHGDMKRRIREILEKVGLSEFARTKAAKLSGGQKQRVAIARALAKDTEIIVADEPTGNLDSEAAGEVARLLSDISKDKLVIVVTHNYDQFAGYATRRVKMHDGTVIENMVMTREPAAGTAAAGPDATGTPDAPEAQASQAKTKKEKKPKPPRGRLSLISRIRLGWRNTFNVAYKFFLLLLVFLFMVVAVTSQYTSYLNQKAEAESIGYNSYFYNYSANRIVLKKVDGSKFTDVDYEALVNVANIDSIARNDMVLDQSVYLENDNYSYETFMHTTDEFTGDLVRGRMPEADNEAILVGHNGDYMFSASAMDQVLEQEFSIYVGSDTKIKLKISGIALDGDAGEYDTAGDLYLQDSIMDQVLAATYSSISTVTSTINDQVQEYTQGSSYFRIMPNDKVKKGQALVYDEVNNYYESGKAIGHHVRIHVSNMYYEDRLKLKIAAVYSEKKFSSQTGYKSFDDYGGAVFISHEDYNDLFCKGNYQCSVYVDDLDQESQTLEALQRMGYTTLALKDALVTSDTDMTSMLQVPMMIIILLAVFFIGYIVIRLVFRSRRGYFSILRMLGMSKRHIRGIIRFEVLLVMNIAFAIFMAAVVMVNMHILDIQYIATLIKYMEPVNYVILYAVMVIMSLIISARSASSLFRKTAVGSFREEA